MPSRGDRGSESVPGVASAFSEGIPFEIDRSLYAGMCDPMVGDPVRRRNTNPLVGVERDDAPPGDETLWNYGKTNRLARNRRVSRSPAESATRSASFVPAKYRVRQSPCRPFYRTNV